jgi:hypothetical protein
MELINKRICPYSKKEFIPKRSNQIFFDKDCRNRYHNAINNKLRKELRKVNNAMLKNYTILTEILGKKSEATVHVEFLKGKGFCMQTITGVSRHADTLHYIVYQYKLSKIDSTQFKIVRL